MQRRKNEGSQNKDLYKILHLYYIMPLCKARKWGSQNKDLYKVLHLYSIMPLCKVKKRRSQNKDLYKVLHLYSIMPLCKVKKRRSQNKYYRANLPLGGTIRNVTPQISKAHPTLKQHRTHKEELFISNYLSKGYINHVEFETLIKFTKKNVLM
jgi:hypothetical protein